VQEHDTVIDQLRHRRETLPARQELADRMAALQDLERTVTAVESRREDLRRSQTRLEDEVAALNDKIAQVDKTMYSGTVTSPRELQAMQEEIDSLKRRTSTLEDEVIDIMELTEPVDAELEALAGQRSAIDGEAMALTASIAEEETAIDAELAAESAKRDGAAEGIPERLLGEYDTLRSRLKGIAVARLVSGHCNGCHLALSAVEVDRIRHEPPDAVVYCEECGRILVHS
jgi:predicted  nucleic acid-binding Zn-ribbon protein